jgi:tetratricopeptide (TPR) repeat protein
MMLAEMVQMAKRVLARLCLALALVAAASAAEYRGSYVTVVSDLDPAYVRFATANADAFYKSLSAHYFRNARIPSLTIYYAKDQAEMRRLQLEHGQKDATDRAYCAANGATLYAHFETRDDRAANCGRLFADITSCFVHQSDPNAPAWFEQGLRRFFADQARIAKGQLLIAHPAPGQQPVLKRLIDERAKPTINRLISSTDRQFEAWEAGPDLAQSLFYWLFENGFLQQYITAAQRRRYDVSLLEEVTSRPLDKVNVDLYKFIRNNCRAADLLAKALASEDPNEKKTALSEALELQPKYHAARLELAKCFYAENNLQKSREMFAEIMGAPDNVEYRQAAQWMAVSFEAEKDTAKAVEYYTKAWDASPEYEYRYRLAYQIASSYYRLDDEANAKIWYQRFLDEKWDPQVWTQQVDFAKKYLELDSESDPNQSSCPAQEVVE